MKVFDFGQLRMARRRCHLKEEEVAHVLHVTRPTISNMENGTVKVAAEDLAVLANLFGMQVEDFYIERIGTR